MQVRGSIFLAALLLKALKPSRPGAIRSRGLVSALCWHLCDVKVEHFRVRTATCLDFLNRLDPSFVGSLENQSGRGFINRL